MKEFFNILKEVKLFKNIRETDLTSMLSCLGAKAVNFGKDQFILMAGDKVNKIGIVLEGNAHIIRENIDGERTIITTLSAGDYFAEALCCVGVTESPVSVITTTNSIIMLLEFSRILHSCPNACLFHAQLIENMLYVIAQKNILLQGRMDIISRKTVRMKILGYLESIALKRGKNITIPLNREEMADFLCIDRSALSHELSRMKKEGLIEYRKNHFTLL